MLLLFLSLLYNRFTEGISAIQGGHQVVQKFRNIALPLRFARSVVIPSEEVNRTEETTGSAEVAEAVAAGLGSKLLTSGLSKPVLTNPVITRPFTLGLNVMMERRTSVIMKPMFDLILFMIFMMVQD